MPECPDVMATSDVNETLDFEVSPNPATADVPVRITLNNGYYGPIQVALVGLDGRVISTFLANKNERIFSKLLPLAGEKWSAGFIRIRGGEHVASKLVFKL